MRKGLKIYLELLDLEDKGDKAAIRLLNELDDLIRPAPVAEYLVLATVEATLLPDLHGEDPKELEKAYNLREKALVRMPAIEHLMYLPELSAASWWIKNIRRLHMPKIWISLENTIEAKNDLAYAIR